MNRVCLSVKSLVTSLFAVLAWGIAPISAAQPLTLSSGDHIAIIGNAFGDRMQHHGWLETLTVARFPKHDLVFRNLSAPADEVATWHRSENFGTRDEWLTRAKADVILACYGFNESFAGDPGLDRKSVV